MPTNISDYIGQNAEDVSDGDDYSDVNIPVTPLGINGQNYFYIDANDQLITLKASEHGRLPLMGLFGQYISVLYNRWPRKNNAGEITGWRPEKCAEQLVSMCSQKGIIDLNERVRGVGAWRGPSDELILHCGDRVITHGKIVERPGVIGDHVYPAAAAVDPPVRDAVGTEVAAEVLRILQTWNWKRPEVDPYLCLGWIGNAKLGGALKWRPLLWVTGDMATGKSTLHNKVRELLGGAVLAVSDATAAAIYQRLKQSAVPVELDEMEPSQDGDNSKQNKVIELARQCCSSNQIIRGGTDKNPVEFTARSCFMFSSIDIPPLLPQDRSRFAILDLRPIEGDMPKLPTPAHMRALGSQLTRRLADGWPRLDELTDMYVQRLYAAGHDSRGADQFGTLLACADLMLNDHPPSADELGLWCEERLDPKKLREYAGRLSSAETCLQHLLSMQSDVYRGGARSLIADMIADANSVTSGMANGVSHDLGTLGMRIYPYEGTTYLAVATGNHNGIKNLYRDTRWSGGGWSDALQRLDGALSLTKRIRIGNIQVRGSVLVPMDKVLEGDAG